jgi:hypothetical protein
MPTFCLPINFTPFTPFPASFFRNVFPNWENGQKSVSICRQHPDSNFPLVSIRKTIPVPETALGCLLAYFTLDLGAFPGEMKFSKKMA